ncbi:molybdopterin synthase catalytic subunit MoaE [Accumulibacter sp.]|uniref:molybdopterin synthase catalytic subunit MoaE n=1 Tax=Accumulibacter sp. TaxID=2053492 RepID=UPI0025FB8F47|nr:molybdopterin synthase catalytic subunit MoaE [Accumulibacter sp.]MCM8610484.1 molybdopterin synthase catalytic subunit MoaE [Accumulibacter sp.]MCM8634384.1 molybdopterin synthase catalytic subunit MoaE [Accumulibacter sp.]MCM8641577.1 molybdopterin synthase catalytic subunit MoaE [Accumulibacter sp.]
MPVRIQEADFDIGSELADLCRAEPRVGALASFVGLVRDVSGGDGVSEMSLEHYPGMTEKALAAIVGEALQRWSLIDALVIHRVGRLLPGDRIVLVAVAAAHRAEAFAACEFIMDYLKTRAPFWKRELTAAGARWVEARDDDDRAAERWRQPGG